MGCPRIGSEDKTTDCQNAEAIITIEKEEEPVKDLNAALKEANLFLKLLGVFSTAMSFKREALKQCYELKKQNAFVMCSDKG